MGRFQRWFRWPVAGRALAVELAGLTFVAVGLYEIYQPAAVIFAGSALVFIAQGLEPKR
jgi:hypothetical protein